ncbi:HAMP domain-containing protein [Amycolatopsis rubida]|uniref:histidine kinase n=1 Tax=Amycolatopsis rubida TaxID=112413 RepID=A0ABX0BTV7_9PSEU|nr:MULTISPECIES: ATP-binding protein [Amycolatopsis]MYW92166.1 HAMP domain-containing protein [Amycolatopsis rubida]NEC57153.1 HAMP domain-containing protein [Amycolatopsis rubida]OAP27665.1 Adaptive-response sensory-kinase SasA [Amycolatopsis sp. M39]
MRDGSARPQESAARLLDRLGIRTVQARVTVLVVAPLVLVVASAVPLVLSQVTAASAAATTSDAVARGQRVGGLVGQVQRESLLTAAFAADPSATDSELVRQRQAVDSAARGIADSLVSPGGALSKLRQNALNRQVSVVDIASGYDSTSIGLIDALGLATSDSSQARTLDALLRADEQRAAAATALVAAAGADRAGQRAAVSGEQFARLAGKQDAAQVAAVETGATAQQLDRLAAAPRQDRQFVSDVVTAGTRLADQRDAVETRIAGAIADAASAEASSATRTASVVGGAAIVLFGLVAALSVLAARSIARPLRRLSGQARSTADLAAAELVQVAEPESGPPQPLLPALEAGTGGELAELADAFNRLRGTGVEAVAEQANSRRAGVQLLVGAAKRTQNLVAGQRTVIEELTRGADDPVLLAGLRRVEHAALRLRRTADDLLVVTGNRDETRVGGPIELATALRSAAAEIDDEARIRLGEPAEALLAPSLGIDLVLLFAELLENAAAFSPPESAVEISTEFQSSGDLLVSIADHGVGLSADRLAQENRRLAEPVDAASGQQLGLAVAGRLAQRHSLRVELESTPEGGVTAQVSVPQALFTRDVDFRRGPGLFEPGQVPDPRPVLLPAPAIAALSTPAPAGFRWFTDPPEPEADEPNPDKDEAPRWPEAEPEFASRAGTLELPDEPEESKEDTPDAQDVADPSPTHQFTVVPPESRDGVFRRVPGAQLAPGLKLPQIVRTPLPRRDLRDPAAERATFDSFSDGVAKAQQVTAQQADQGGS